MAELVLNAGDAGRTLAIPNTQVLVEMEDSQYMHHILLLKLEAGVWIAVDAQGVVERPDLRELEVSPLLGDADFPAEDRPYTVFNRAVVTDAMMSEWRGRARRLATVLGFDSADTGPGAGPDTAWYFADPAVKVFGQEVDAAEKLKEDPIYENQPFTHLYSVYPGRDPHHKLYDCFVYACVYQP